MSDSLPVRIAVLTDLHANREALEAVLDHVARQNVQGYALLGDFVGYGADPSWVLDRVRGLVDQGAIAVQGNHDLATVQGASPEMRPEPRQVIDWTQSQLSSEQIDFLAQLPLLHETPEVLYVHANAWAPAGWGYILSRLDAVRSLHATRSRITFCGHVHEPQLYHLSPIGKAGDLCRRQACPFRCCRSASGWCCPAAWASRATATPPRVTRCMTAHKARSPTGAYPTTTRPLQPRSALPACPPPWEIGSRMASDTSPPAVPGTRLTEGQVIDGFVVGERLHQGGMATIWSVQRETPGGDSANMPLVMKVPRIKGGEDPATIVGFEVEQMIMPALSGPHVPRFVARGDFTRTPTS
jgi:predicted phosphodiesterase